MNNDAKLAQEAKSLVAFAFRSGPIEDVHFGEACPTCSDQSGYSHITEDEMKAIMKNAVNKVYMFLQMKKTNPEDFDQFVEYMRSHTYKWDEPELDALPAKSADATRAAAN